MNNIFKTNSRFAALAEDRDNNDNRSNDNRSNDNRSNDNRSNDNRSNRGQGIFENNQDYMKRKTLEQAKKKEDDEKLELDKINKMMEDPNSFPDLLGTKKNTTTEVKYISFSDKLKNTLKTEIDNKKSEAEKEKEKVLPKPGWVSIIRNPKTGKTTVVSNYVEKKTKPKTDNEYAMEVLTALCDLHERTTQEHIDRYGYDAWERKFRDPDWDHEYYDRLDEEYEEEMEKERIREMRELEDDDDEYVADPDNYWKH
jgi:hypothetical protein